MEGERSEHRRRPGTAVIIAASLALGACAGPDNLLPASPGQTTAEEAPDSDSANTMRETTATIPAELCSFRSVEVGESFTSENSERISEQLLLIDKLHKSVEPVDLADIKVGGGIIRDSHRDPLYAEAMVRAIDVLGRGEQMDAQAFLATPVSTLRHCDARHLHKEDMRAHLQRTVSVGDFIATRAASQLGTQASEYVQRAVDAVRDYVGLIKAELESYRRNSSD